MRHLASLSVLLVVLAAALAVSAPSAWASHPIKVTVVDKNGRTIDNADVTVETNDTPPNTSSGKTGTAGESGVYREYVLGDTSTVTVEVTYNGESHVVNAHPDAKGKIRVTVTMQNAGSGQSTQTTAPSPVVNTSLNAPAADTGKPASEQELSSNVRRTLDYYGVALGASLILKTMSAAITYDYLTGGNSAHSTRNSTGIGGGLDMLYWVPKSKGFAAAFLPTYLMATVGYMPALSAIAARAAFHFANSVDSYVKVRESVMLRIALGYQLMALQNFYFYGVFGLQGTLLSMLASTNELGNITEYRKREFVWGPTAGLQIMHPAGFNNIEAFFYGSLMFTYVPGMTVNFRSFSNFQYAARVASWVQPALMFGVLFKF
ncbi:MAG: hypothetical protein H6907_07305 [Hyphomicrobiales bacterium]|nr:hypothetical protein [Hyphomicrobiales bacterium]MCP5371530.1 hypothetical protein [Hyphomicrobiales bacterium]